MTTSMAQIVCEYLMLALDVVRRRWHALVLPLALTLPAAVFAVKVLPKEFESTSLVLIQSGSNTPRYRNNDPIRAIEAWLKSNHTLNDLLPKLIDDQDISDKEEREAQIKILRSAIEFKPLGGTAYEISLTMSKPEGLGRKLEIVLSRITEGLTGPNRDIFSASQFVLQRRSESIRKSQIELQNSIVAAGLPSPELTMSYLRTIVDLDSRIQPLSQSGRTNPKAASLASRLSEERQRTEKLISNDPNVVNKLLAQFEIYQQAKSEFEPLRERLSAQTSNYVGIFDPSASLIIVGRPQDPVFGRSPAKKYAAVLILFTIMGGCGLVFLLELFYPGVRLRSEFEELAGVNVVARFSRPPGARRI